WECWSQPWPEAEEGPVHTVKVLLYLRPELLLNRTGTCSQVWGNSLGRFPREPFAYFYSAFGAAEIWRQIVLAQSFSNSSAQRYGLRFPSEKLNHHCRGQDRSQWVRNFLSRNVGRGAMHGLKKRSSSRMN